MTSTGPILIAYAGSILTGADAVVLYVREPLEGLAAHLEGHPVLEGSWTLIDH